MVYQLNKISVHYSGHTALHEVSCTIQEGKWISVIGQTGAGKSTFAKVLKGLIADIEGEYLIDHQPVTRDTKGQLKVIPDIGFVFQYPEHQLFETTVHKELAFAPKQHGYTSNQIMERIQSILPQVGLSEEILPLPPFQLSGGQKRRLAIASVFMMDPKVLIVDEPTAGLDPVSRVAMLRLLKNWQQQDNRTLIFVSHQMEDVAEYSDEVIVFQGGEIMGHYDTNTIFIEKSQLLEELGLSLPESIQLLKLVEELSGVRIQVASCREEDIMNAIMSIWNTRSV
ncbi:ATP-binding cassette domain-containing protein [Paenibacillus sp. EC2-1]|uniref:ATP-binding cassette domain-containing protein n=1 Tax=Paenibacillus sp. EC2-1 TaxID=3388665 RepID=UPI003BEEDA6D